MGEVWAMEIRDFCTKDTPKREEIGGAWRWKNGNKKGPQQQIATALSGVSICKTLCASYFSSTLPPASSTLAFMASASSLDRPSFKVLGAPSTVAFASAKP